MLCYFYLFVRVPDPKYDAALVEEIHGDLQEWSNVRQLTRFLCVVFIPFAVISFSL